MAAYDGNADRYARLMDPREMGQTEVFCVIRGIYHNTIFARWWSDQLDTKNNIQRVHTFRIKTEEITRYIRTAINARRVMVNDISGFNNETPYQLFLI